MKKRNYPSSQSAVAIAPGRIVNHVITIGRKLIVRVKQRKRYKSLGEEPHGSITAMTVVATKHSELTD